MKLFGCCSLLSFDSYYFGTMNEMVCHLKFKDVSVMSNFILDNEIKDVAAFSRTNTLIGLLNVNHIELAFQKYGASGHEHYLVGEE
jgi:hypothetical protein